MGGGQSPEEQEGGEKKERERAETRGTALLGEAEEDPNLVLRDSSALGTQGEESLRTERAAKVSVLRGGQVRMGRCPFQLSIGP